jgi:acetyltransferase-like isoleucine patch superfamily enzyme
MKLHKIKKTIALVRFLLLKVFFRKSAFMNFIYSNTFISGFNRIYLGEFNVIQKDSSLIVDSNLDFELLKIGDRNRIASFAILKTHGGTIVMGNDNFIGERTQIQGRGGVEIGNNCLIAANTFISSSNHNFENPFSNDYLTREVSKKTKIDDFVWIGANCVIVAGVNIGHHSIIGAGTIVTNHIAPYTMVVGNPGRVIRKFDKTNGQWVKI